VSLHLRELPVPVIGLVSALYQDQRNNPHRSATDYPLRNVMLTAQRFDKSGRTRSEYESLSALVQKWARRQMRPDAACNECASLMSCDYPADDLANLGYRHVFALRPTFNSYFLCSQCSESWLSEGDAGLPRITGLKHFSKHDERCAKNGKDKLPSLPPSGALFAGLIIPGGSEPITVPLRAGDSALPNVSRILNTLRFEEVA
jgi:hypothetical protein